jgi:hypothetical protein
MKKTVLLIVLGVITIFCICYGTYKHLKGFDSIFKDGINISFDDDEYDNDEKNDGKYSIDEKLEKFSSIRLNAAVMGITIEQGDEFRIESSFNKEILRPVFSINGNQLVVTQGRRKQQGINMGSQNCRTVITIPSGTSLSSIDIDSNVGNVRLREIDAEDIDVNLNVGEIDVRNVDFTEINCNTNVGEISINPVSKLNEYDINASTDVGEIRINGRNYKKRYNSSGNGHKKIKANTNVGEINVN